MSVALAFLLASLITVAGLLYILLYGLVLPILRLPEPPRRARHRAAAPPAATATPPLASPPNDVPKVTVMPPVGAPKDHPQTPLVVTTRTVTLPPSRSASVDVQYNTTAAIQRAYCADLESYMRAIEREDRFCERAEREEEREERAARRRARDRAELASIRQADRVQAAKADGARRVRKREELEDDERATRAIEIDDRTHARNFAGEKAERARKHARAEWREADALREDARQTRTRKRRTVQTEDLRSEAQTAANDAAALKDEMRANELARIDHQITVHERRAVLASLREPPPVDPALEALTHECEAIALDVSTGTVLFDANNLYHGFAGLKFREAQATLSPEEAIEATVEALVSRRHGHREFTPAEAQAFFDRYHALTKDEAEREGIAEAKAVLQEFGIGTEDTYGNH